MSGIIILFFMFFAKKYEKYIGHIKEVIKKIEK